MLYNYNAGIKELFNNKGYLPGQSTNVSDFKVVEAMNTNSAIEFGQVVKREPNSNKPLAVNIEEDDAYNVFYGIAKRDIVSQAQVDYSGEANIISSYGKGQPVSVVREGMIAVPVQKGKPVVGGQVWVRVKPSLDNSNLPIGGIEAEADVGNVAWKGVFFGGEAGYAVDAKNYTTDTLPTAVTAKIVLTIQEYGILPHITQAPTATTAVYGTKFSEIVLTGGSAENDGTEVSGKFVMNNASQVPEVGTHTYTATFIPDDLTKYEKVTNVEVVVTIEEG